MIIDSHVHIGITSQYAMPKEMVLYSMKQYGISMSIISNIRGIEKQDNVTYDYQKEVNQEAIDFARQYRDKIRVLLWARPEAEGCNKEFIALLRENRDVVCGIKIHPSGSLLKISDLRIRDYVKLAGEEKVPILFHTSADGYSDLELLYDLAEEFPTVRFIMGHMGLRTDRVTAVKMLLNTPNLFGDTAWVPYEAVIELVKNGGEDKILFGSDNPINGADTYGDREFYIPYRTQLPAFISEKAYEKLMWKNAANLFFDYKGAEE